jgi:hypothetical protein
MKPTHICTFSNSENIVTEIIVTSQSKVRHLPTTLFHYLDPKGIGTSKKAVRYFRMVTRKNGKWNNNSIPNIVTTYSRSN